MVPLTWASRCSTPTLPGCRWPVTNRAVFVSNGLFTTTVDFGAGVFTGDNLWLGLTVDGAAELLPRQPITPTPYAL